MIDNRQEETVVIRVTGTGRETETRQPEQNVIPTPFRLFEDLFNDWALRSLSTRRRDTWKPAVDIFKEDNIFIIRKALPGIAEKDFDLRLDGRTLTIQAENKIEPEDSGICCHQVESFYGTCNRSFDLPDTVETEKISASYNKGVLTVTIPLKSEVKPRSIKVSIG